VTIPFKLINQKLQKADNNKGCKPQNQ